MKTSIRKFVKWLETQRKAQILGQKFITKKKERKRKSSCFNLKLEIYHE